jgi:hypothetical protein
MHLASYRLPSPERPQLIALSGRPLARLYFRETDHRFAKHHDAVITQRGAASRLEAMTPTWFIASVLAVRTARSSLC